MDKKEKTTKKAVQPRREKWETVSVPIMVEKKRAPAEKTGELVLTVNLEGVNHEYRGATALDCLEQFADEFRGKTYAKGKTTLHTEHSSRSKDFFLYPIQTKRFFGIENFRLIIAKRLEV